MLAGVEGTRTPSPRFWRPVLCQLSYTPIARPSAPSASPMQAWPAQRLAVACLCDINIYLCAYASIQRRGEMTDPFSEIRPASRRRRGAVSRRGGPAHSRARRRHGHRGAGAQLRGDAFPRASASPPAAAISRATTICSRSPSRRRSRPSISPMRKPAPTFSKPTPSPPPASPRPITACRRSSMS